MSFFAALLAITLATSSTPIAALDCDPDSITLSTQSDVDDFQIDHGPCDQVVGILTISGADIANLDGLSEITALSGGALIVRNNPSLSDLSGLSNLASIAASLVVENNDSIAHLDGLGMLTSVAGNISIINNGTLASIGGLSGVTGFAASLTIRHNPMLSSLAGLSGFTDLIGLVIEDNDSLTDLDPLSGLTNIGNGYSSLFINDNDALTNVNGLSDLVSLDADLEITDNPILGGCSGLITLLDEIDDALPGPGPGPAMIPDINGDVFLYGNLTDCNSVAAILVSRIFADGFESGNTTGWSATVPE